MATPRTDITTPVTIGAATIGLVSAILAMLVAFGVTLSQEQLTTIIAVVSAALIAAPLYLHKLSIARTRVVEQTDAAGVITAGPASELPTGEVIRHLGDLPPRRAEIATEDQPAADEPWD